MGESPPVHYPHGGWLAEYIDYASRGLRSPRLYHLACGLFCVCVTAGRNTRILGAGDPVPLNLYMCVVGPSGFAQKSRTLDRARQVLAQARDGVLLPDEFSREQLFADLARDSHRVLLWREFGKLLQVAKRDYMAGLLEFLTELYDCPTTLKRTLRGEAYTIERPYVSILTASTPEWLFPHMADLDILAGFFPRFLFVLFDQPLARRAETDLPTPQQVNTIVKDLARIASSRPEIHLGRTVELFHRYEDEIEKRALRPGFSPFMQAFYARLPLLVLKVAGCYHLASKEDNQLAPETFAHAINLVESQARALQQYAAAKWGRNRDGLELGRVRDIILAEPRITHGRLLKNSHLAAGRLKEMLRTVRETGELRQEGTGKRGDPIRYWIEPLPEIEEK